jgi:hypothetical protein
MAKAIVSKYWNEVLEGWDGQKRTWDPAGILPSGWQTQPRVVIVGRRAVSPTGGEFNAGSYLRIYGYNFGRRADLGTDAGCRLFLRDPLGDNAWHEVANYRELSRSRTYNVNQLVRVTVQVGALGGGMVAGHPLDLKVRVNGVDSPVKTACLVVHFRDTWFASPTGDDASGVKNDIAHPFRYVQHYTTDFVGIWTPTTGIQPGDDLVMMGGDWSDQVGFDGKFLRPLTQTGSAPTGAAGTGPYHITSYPGPVLAHAPADAHITVPSGGGGGITGPSETRSGEGYGKWFEVCELRIDCDPNANADAAPINLQTNADDWWVIGCECGPWLSTLPTPDNARAGGIAGSSRRGKILACHIHDIDCDANAVNLDVTNKENHGIYMDQGHVAPSDSVEIAYNWIHDIPGGSGLQYYDSGGGWMTGMLCHHNWIEQVNKYCLNLANGIQSIDAWCNVLVQPNGRNALRWGQDSTADTVHRLVHNTIVMGTSTSGYQAAVTQEGSHLDLGELVFQHNIVALFSGAAAAGTIWMDVGAASTAAAFTSEQNLYYDPDGVRTTAPAIDSSSIVGDPVFASMAKRLFNCLTGGAGINACTLAERLAEPDDYYGIDFPVQDTSTPGATRNDIGAIQFVEGA